MKNTIHFFGDSFTEGHALARTNYIWPKLVLKAMFEQFTYRNYGQGGASPIIILKSIIEHLKTIKPGDIVFLLETVPDRIEIYSPHLKKIVSLTNAHLVEAVNSKEDDHFSSYNDIMSAFNFTYDHRYKRMNHFELYYRDMYLNIGEHINSIGARFILIPFQTTFNNIKTGERFETVSVRTKGKFIDGHFSIKGHWQFANYILKSNFTDYIELKEPEEKLLI